MLTRWVREADGPADKTFTGAGTPRDQELARPKRELALVTKECNFLHDAAVSSPLFFVFQPIGIMLPISVHAEH